MSSSAAKAADRIPVLPPESVEARISARSTGADPVEISVPVLDPVLGEIPPEYAALDGDDKSEFPTLAEVGRVLPIGFRDATGKVHREFELVDWDWDLEEAVGEIAEANPNMPMGEYVSEIIGAGVRSLGTTDVAALPRSRRRLLVSQLYYADALYLYVWIRIGALGPHLRLGAEPCESCGKSSPFVGDLRSLEVKVVESEAPEDVVELERPFRYGKVDVRRVRVAPLRWAFQETADLATLRNPAKARLAVLRHGVVGLEGVEGGAPTILTREHARQIGVEGINRIVAAVDDVGGGAVMECEGECRFCRARFRRTIDWSYGDFFGPSSR